MRYRILLALWVITDMLLFVASYAAAYFLRVGLILSSNFPFDRYIITSIEVSPIWLLMLASTRTFLLTHRQTSLRNGAFIAYTGVVGVALFTLLYYFVYTQFFSRLLLLEALIIQVIVTWVWHIIYDQMKRSMLRASPPTFPTLLVGVTRETQELIKHLQERKSALCPVAILENKGIKDKEIHGVPVLGKLNKLEQVLRDFRITHLIQCADMEQSINLSSACRNLGITYIVLPSVFGIIERDEQIESLEGRPVTVIHPTQTWWGKFFV